MRIDLINRLAENGKVFTFDKAVQLFGMSRGVTKVILFRLEARGFIERIEKGRYMLLPLGAQTGKYTLNEFVIGSLLVKPYAISYWSALHYHGLTEQAPSTVFIQTTARKKHQEVKVFDVKYRFVRVKGDKFFGIKTAWLDETEVSITSPEKTVVDCLDKPQYSGGVVEVAKALRKNNWDTRLLLEYARKIGNSGVLRRLGYLCDDPTLNKNIWLDTRNYLLLDPTMPEKGEKNARWRLIINTDLKGVLE